MDYYMDLLEGDGNDIDQVLEQSRHGGTGGQRDFRFGVGGFKLCFY